MRLPNTARPRKHVSPLSRLRHPQTTVRWRLTLLYGGTFLVCGAALLAITYTLVAHGITGGWGIVAPEGARPSSAAFNRSLAPARAAAQQRLANPPSPGDSAISPRPSGAAGFGGGATPLPPPDLTMPKMAPGLLHIFESSAGQEFLRLVELRQQVNELDQLETESAIALGIMAIVSGLLGWLVAGRVLRPLRTITATTQEISEADLHRRLQMPGPRDELRTLADTIDGLLARLEAAFESQRRFVANASHELRTPLTTMRTALDVVSAKPQLSSSQLRALDASLREDLDKADRLIESFLVLARAQRGTLGEETSVSLAQVVGDALGRSREMIAAKQIELHSTLAPARVEGSDMLLARMVDNLIDNAVRHNSTRGLIDVTCDADRQTARLVVESGGPRLDDRAVEQLAEPFRRLGAERTGSQNGHGLGLSIVATIAAAHGGGLRLYARKHGGLGAEITLPAAGAQATTVPA